MIRIFINETTETFFLPANNFILIGYHIIPMKPHMGANICYMFQQVVFNMKLKSLPIVVHCSVVLANTVELSPEILKGGSKKINE